MFFEIDGGQNVGKVLQVRTPVGTPSHASAPPRLGEHTRDVLREYGLSDAQIASLAVH
jgi:crotonobetainyl-CoA:carnitine CoA-transferase CaiB-like acyl-CoA transferase